MTTYAEIGTPVTTTLDGLSGERKSWLGVGFLTLCMVAILYGRVE